MAVTYTEKNLTEEYLFVARLSRDLRWEIMQGPPVEASEPVYLPFDLVEALELWGKPGDELEVGIRAGIYEEIEHDPRWPSDGQVISEEINWHSLRAECVNVHLTDPQRDLWHYLRDLWIADDLRGKIEGGIGAPVES